MTLRYFLTLTLACIAVSLTLTNNAGAADPPLKVNQQRLENNIFELAKIGLKDNGERNRVAYSPADLKARDYAINLMKEANLDVSIDYAGNITGRRKGKDTSKKPIVFGSHIDAVPNGGIYDGCLGSMAAIEAIETLNDKGITTTHPLEVIIFSNEEGGAIGSSALVGELDQNAFMVKNSTGLTIKEGIKLIGGDPAKIKQVEKKQGDWTAFLELHIEQGGVLDQENIQIGVVDGIVGINWWKVEITGAANHAGTTPMNMRRDALLAASKFIIAVNEVITGYEGKQVGTVGEIDVKPGVHNVVPGKVTLSLEIRDLSTEKILMLYADIEKKAQQIAKESNVEIALIKKDVSQKPAITYTLIKDKIAESSNMLGLGFKYMQSGAGHDAQNIAQIAPTGMIFVPSQNGISHAPDEFTTVDDMINGANVLLNTILNLDRDFVKQ